MAVEINKGTVMYQLPITPMVDLVFNLLLFFVVVTRFAAEEQELRLALPVASEAQPLVARPQALMVSIDREGSYVLAGRVIGLGELEFALKTASATNPGRASVVVRADGRCPWKYIAAALNACRKANIRDYHVTTGG